MTYSPVIPVGGLAGWRFLQRTYDAQFEAFASSRIPERDAVYFTERIGEITSAEELVSDRRLLAVALGAFGLEADLNNRYFIRKIMEEGTVRDDALANRLADDRYEKLSAAFGFGPGETVRTRSTDAMLKVVEDFKRQGFETAVGAIDDTMRIGLYAQRELPEIAARQFEDSTGWFKIMGQPPLRKFLETALGLPPGFGQIDIDQQLSVFRDRTQAITGNNLVQQFNDPDVINKLMIQFQARSQINDLATESASASIALTLLQSISGR